MTEEVTNVEFFATLLQVGLVFFNTPQPWLSDADFLAEWLTVTGTPMPTYGYTTPQEFFYHLREIRLVRIDCQGDSFRIRPRRVFWHTVADLAERLFFDPRGDT